MKISNERCVHEQEKLKKQNKRTRESLAQRTNWGAQWSEERHACLRRSQIPHTNIMIKRKNNRHKMEITRMR